MVIPPAGWLPTLTRPAIETAALRRDVTVTRHVAVVRGRHVVVRHRGATRASRLEPGTSRFDIEASQPVGPMLRWSGAALWPLLLQCTAPGLLYLIGDPWPLGLAPKKRREVITLLGGVVAACGARAAVGEKPQGRTASPGDESTLKAIRCERGVALVSKPSSRVKS
jgi:hypothetical protein